MSTTILIRTGLAGALLVLAASPAMAAKPVPVKLECSATRAGWSEPREFTVDFVRTTNKLRSVVVNERARVFTPSDATAFFRVGKGGRGVIYDLPEQRPGKWEGKPNGELEEFTLKTKDGAASFVLTPDAADAARKLLTWKADMPDPAGEQLTAEGEGSCRVVPTEEDEA